MTALVAAAALVGAGIAVCLVLLVLSAVVLGGCARDDGDQLAEEATS